MVAFGISRLSGRLNLALLIVFAAGSLLPPQVLVIPLFRLFLALPLPAPLSDNGLLYDQLAGLVVINVAFQLGFCTFVLSNYLRTVPGELVEAAVIDGASLHRALWAVVVPISRPAIAALAALQTTWIYNDYLWGLVLMRTGDKRPITSALNGLRGEYFTDTNLLAAASILVALPTLVVFLVARRQLRRGLTLGAVRG
jgi:multiple sugar transport system permease protein